MLQPYIESATTFFYYIDDEEIARISGFSRSVDGLAGTRNVSVDLKYDVLCF